MAAFGLLLRDSKYKGTASFERVLQIAESSLTDDPGGYRAEFIRLVQRARTLMSHQ